ncbi:MAG TPA: hypothetical protein VGD98_25315 [Ktedonobacteraceae bacterium]
MLKRHTRLIWLSVVIFVLLTALGSLPLLSTYASNTRDAGKHENDDLTINGLHHISIIGNTQFIVDGKKHTASEDANPYGVVIVPATPSTRKVGNLQAGDILVTNIGGNDTGTTLVRFPHKTGPGLLFNKTPNAGTKGPADETFNSANGSVWVSNVNANNVQIFNSDGTVQMTLTNPLFNHPWGMTSNQNKPNGLDKSVGSFFISNTRDATIDRIDIIPTTNGKVFKVFQIGKLKMNGDETKIGLLWTPSLTIGGKTMKDVLLAIDTAANRIAAYPNSTSLNTTNTKSTSKGMTAFQGKPLNMPGGFAFNPFNNDLLVVNLNDNNLLELNLNQGKVVGIKQIDNVPVDLQTGNGSALFGVAATKDPQGHLVVFFTDDNTNTLDQLSL